MEREERPIQVGGKNLCKHAKLKFNDRQKRGHSQQWAKKM